MNFFNFFNFLKFLNPFYWWNQLFPPPSQPEPIIEPEPEDPQDFDPDGENME